MTVCAAELQNRLDKLEEAISRSERKVKFSDGREVEYKTIDEMTKAVRYLQSQISSANSEVRRRRRAFPISVDRGL